MATAPTMTVNVNLEQAIHKSLRDLVQQIHDEHGVRITDLQVDWLNVSNTAEHKYIAQALRLTTSTG